jgi:hypothetical protein
MPRGGYRPGAGAKKQATVEAQESNRDTVLRIMDEPYSPDFTIPTGVSNWEAVTYTAVKECLKGNMIALANLLPYIAGGKPTAPIEIQATSDVTVWLSTWQPDHERVIDGTATELTDGIDPEPNQLLP